MAVVWAARGRVKAREKTGSKGRGNEERPSEKPDKARRVNFERAIMTPRKYESGGRGPKSTRTRVKPGDGPELEQLSATG